MHWEKIQGWFTFKQLYDNMINKFPTGSTFVEIGTWKGKSAVYMGEKMKEVRKIMNFYTIDLFLSRDNDHKQFIDVEDLYKEAVKNIEPVKDVVNIIKGSSHEIYNNFEDGSIDFLFIDGGHTYECVKKDLQLWFPKVKYKGIISGHDYEERSAGIRKAVDEFFSFNVLPYVGGCWYKEK